MFSNRSIQSSNRDMSPGQSLFDFLKRKKKYTLQASLQNTKYKQNIKIAPINKYQHKKNQQYSISPHKQYEDAYRQNLMETLMNSQTKNILSHTNTPKKVSFLQEKDKQKKQHTARSSFIQMISPMKKKIATASLSQDTNTISRQNQLSHTEKQKIKPINTQQYFHRKNINNSINVFKSTFQTLVTSTKSLKQKWHIIYIQLKPLIKFMEQCSNPTICQRTCSLKQKLIIFQQSFNNLPLENQNQLIEQLHNSLSSHLADFQSNLKSTSQRQHLQTYKKLKTQKQKIIDQLQSEKVSLQREVQLMNKKIQKINLQSQNYKQSSQFVQFKDQHFYHNKINQLNNKILGYEEQIDCLAKQVSTCRNKEKQLNKMLKDLKLDKEQTSRKFVEDGEKVKASREEFLLNQISTLKNQFRNDMEQLTLLYSSKEKEHLKIIEEMKNQLIELHQQRTSEKENEGRLMNNAFTDRRQLEKYRLDNESLVRDLHRMNQQLYQHWLALKDIKTLAERLQIFNKFYKIYEDMTFNEKLFL